MALEVLTPALSNEHMHKAGVTDNGEYTYPAGEEITGPDLLSLISNHEQEYATHYYRDRKYYKGDHKINKQTPKASYKPDNRVIFNFPRKAVTTFNGYFIGNPISIDTAKDAQADAFITEWRRANDFDAVMSDVSKMASIYGHSYILVYQSVVKDDSETPEARITALDPLNAFLIYDDTYAHEVKYGVLYSYDYQGHLQVTLYDDTFMREFSRTTDGLTQEHAYANPYQMVPLIEVDENSERMALCDDIITLVDQLDKAVSNKANDNDYFADAIMKIVGAKVDKNTYKEMRDQRVINVTGPQAKDADVEFLDKPDNDTSQEHLINRLVSSIYEIANVTNLNDDAFNGNPSGVSLQLKYQAMDNMAKTKTLKFQQALRSLFKAVFAVSYNEVSPDAWKSLDFEFKRSIPVNMLEESQVLANAAGKISNKTLFAQMPFVSDPDEEIKQLKKEQQEAMQTTQSVVQNALNGAQTDQQRAGVASDNSQANSSADNSTGQAGLANRPAAR
ncbi:phage portal protein [Lacticaseibacillus zhaodongensis]|uniref:phage portal protein n=1 Tax=Lacticaseibacillus zhaodongensis TaxID=2668065 RepID=UPI0012D34044|nr:phage portal protein [Lacticaseibacillus zhaodongensis]